MIASILRPSPSVLYRLRSPTCRQTTATVRDRDSPRLGDLIDQEPSDSRRDEGASPRSRHVVTSGALRASVTRNHPSDRLLSAPMRPLVLVLVGAHPPPSDWPV